MVSSDKGDQIGFHLLILTRSSLMASTACIAMVSLHSRHLDLLQQENTGGLNIITAIHNGPSNSDSEPLCTIVGPSLSGVQLSSIHP